MRRVFEVAPVVLPLLVGFSLFSATGRDDSYITYWASHGLARHGAIVNYNGDYVEQSSSLAHAVLLAALTKIAGISVPTLGVLMSVLCGCAAVWLTGRLAEQLDPPSGTTARWLAASWAGLVYWSFGGLEATLAATSYAWLALACVRVVRDGLGIGNGLNSLGATMLSLTVRPEATFLIPGVVVGLSVLVISNSWNNRRAVDRSAILRIVWLGGLTLTIILIVTAWRLWYFDAWFPEPVSAKVSGFSGRRLYLGLRYLARQIGWIDGAVWIVAGVASVVQLWRAWRSRTPRLVMAVPALFTLGGLSIVAAAGEDWMEGGRFLVPILPSAVVVAVTSTQVWLRHRAVFRAVLILQFVGILWLASRASTGAPVWTAAQSVEPTKASWFELRQRVNYRDVIFSERLIDVVQRLRATTGGAVSVMSVQMGLAAYRTALSESGHVRFIDMFGLTTRDFTHCPVTASLRRGSRGLLVFYDFFFAHREDLHRLCGVQAPDVIFDLDEPDWPRARLIAANGYRIVYRQAGTIANRSKWFPGATIRAEEFIAVRNDLSALPPYPEVRFDR